jgi:hydroxymethylglutaryl-CoA synthase
MFFTHLVLTYTVMNKTNLEPSFGIDDISIYFPSLYLDIKDFAKARDIDPAKLEYGLGLKTIAIPDSSEDVITMAAEALCDLVEKNNLQPGDIGRIYVGTESMVDGSKPIASYLLGILKQYFEQKSINTQELYDCDVVDMVFACIGAVDAMQNSLDWVRLNPGKKAIVISTDNAKYDLHSPGESTQGAGAIAMLLSKDPRIIEIGSTWGISAYCEHDFFKPLRLRVRQHDIVSSNGIDASKLAKEVYSEHKDTPVYDGQHSNVCYTDRVSEAFENFKAKTGKSDYLDQWSQLIFHLPYAYHARRVFVTQFIKHLQLQGKWEEFSKPFIETIPENDPKYTKLFLKAVSSSSEYKNFVTEKIEKGERASSLIGNMYTGSIFLSLISSLSLTPENILADKTIGLFAYGSGSKSKVFEARVKPGYQKLIDRINLFERLNNRLQINMHQYEYLHRNKLVVNLDSKDRKIFQTSSGWTNTNKYARQYSIV